MPGIHRHYHSYLVSLLSAAPIPTLVIFVKFLPLVIFFLPWLLFNYRVKYELCIEPFVKMKNLLVLIQSKYYYYNLVHYTANVFNMFRVLYLHIILCVRFIYRFLGSDLLTKRIKRL